MFCMRLINNGALVAGFVSICCTVDMDHLSRPLLCFRSVLNLKKTVFLSPLVKEMIY